MRSLDSLLAVRRLLVLMWTIGLCATSLRAQAAARNAGRFVGASTPVNGTRVGSPAPSRLGAEHNGAAGTASTIDRTAHDFPPPSSTILLATNGADVSVVRVPLPNAVRAERIGGAPGWKYEVHAASHVQPLGVTRGAVTKDSTLLLPLRISRRAPAGRVRAATVLFLSPRDSVAVGVDLDVPAVRALALLPASTSIVATRGRWTSIVVRIANDGNVNEPVSLQVAPPPGWRAVWRPPADGVVAAGETGVGEIRVWVPAEAAAGIALVSVEMALPSGEKQTVLLQLEVIEHVGGRAEGPVLRASVANGFGGTQQPATGYALELSGALSDSTRVSGRFTYAGRAPQLNGASFALARSGVITAPPTLEIAHPKVQLKLGAVANALPDLGGQFLSGLGGGARLRRGAWDARVNALAPPSLSNQFALLARSPGHLTSGEVGYTSGTLRTAVFGSSLADPLARRSLNAIGLRTSLGAGMNQLDGMFSGRGSSLSGEVAFRDFGAGGTLGVSSSYRYSGEASMLDVRALHAPGGSRSFARATNEYAVSASRMFARRHGVSGGGWWQDDANALVGASESRGWFLTPSTSFGRYGSFTLEARGTRFSAGASPMDAPVSTLNPGTLPWSTRPTSEPSSVRLINDELTGGGSYFVDVLGLQFMGRSLLTSARRDFLGADIGTSSSRQTRLENTVMVSRSHPRGTLQATWQHQQSTGLGGGVLPAQQSVQLRVDRVRPFLTKSFELGMEYQRLTLGAGMARFTMARATVTIPLIANSSLTLGAERNPFAGIVSRSGQNAMLYSVRIERTTRLPRPFGGATNLVFRDDNGNGQRDGAERGVSDVAIKCGTRVVVTDRHGRFACDDARREVDARTVPAGLVAGHLRLNRGEALPLRVLQPVRITLRMTSSDSTRVTRAMLERAIVTARDSVGGKWLARSIGDGAFTVDALPVGTYTIAVDGADLDEPVVAVGGPARVRVGVDMQDEGVDVVLRARPMRLRSFGEATNSVPAATSSTSGAAGAASATASVSSTAAKSSVPAVRASEPVPERQAPTPKPNL